MTIIYSRELLSRHRTVATYEGPEEGRESMLKVHPQRPNKTWETFKIVEYCRTTTPTGGIDEGFAKPGQYGDERQTVARFTDLRENHAATLSKLKKGDKVKLEWHHNYVTQKDGCLNALDQKNAPESKYPERMIVLLEPFE
jgi:hypothetical protein